MIKVLFWNLIFINYYSTDYNIYLKNKSN